MRIQMLPSQVINQISAGEVVVRPASVVKELLENSVDAGALSLELEIEAGGLQKIALLDDGGGIPEADLPLALARHATSKLAQFSDFESLSTFGFRGEALASISAVSRLRLLSRVAGASSGYQIYTEGAPQTLHVEPAAHPIGTTVILRDLFYNTPARRKFLRSEKTEFAHIEEVVRRMALAYPALSFRLTHHGKLVRHYIGRTGNTAEPARMGQICGRSFVQAARCVEGTRGGINLRGWVTTQHRTTGNPLQYAFINGRMVRDRVVTHAVRTAYGRYCTEQARSGSLDAMLLAKTVNALPFLLYLTVPSTHVDINVHPTKEEVRFSNNREIHDIIYAFVLQALRDPAACLQTEPLSARIATPCEATRAEGSHTHVSSEPPSTLRSGSARPLESLLLGAEPLPITVSGSIAPAFEDRGPQAEACDPLTDREWLFSAAALKRSGQVRGEDLSDRLKRWEPSSSRPSAHEGEPSFDAPLESRRESPVEPSDPAQRSPTHAQAHDPLCRHAPSAHPIGYLGQLRALYQQRYALLEGEAGQFLLCSLAAIATYVTAWEWQQRGIPTPPCAFADPWEGALLPPAIGQTRLLRPLEHLGFRGYIDQTRCVLTAIPPLLRPHWERIATTFLSEIQHFQGDHALLTLQWIPRMSAWIFQEDKAFTRPEAIQWLADLERLPAATAEGPALDALCIPIALSELCTQLDQRFQHFLAGSRAIQLALERAHAEL